MGIPFRPARPPRFWTAIGLLIVLGPLAGCTGSTKRLSLTTTAEQTLRLYQTALERDDAGAAYKLLTAQLRQRLTFEQFNAQWRDLRAERATQLKLLREPRSGKSRLMTQAVITLTPTLATAPGGALGLGTPGIELTLLPASSATQRLGSGGGWRLADADLGAVRADTPEQVLRLLLDAVEQRSYFALLRLLSVSERQALETELRERIERLRATLSRNQPVEIRGDHARFQYDPRFFIELVREKEGWRIFDLN